ncbi:MAG: alpha/beta fold hydrolase [Actinomycetia bacterium]|nr:alpha/beta fold hydrolase [Actinomycetes bacterium]
MTIRAQSTASPGPGGSGDAGRREVAGRGEHVAARGGRGAARGEQTRARYPDAEGYLERDGVRVFYETYGTGEPVILLLPTWEIVHSRAWKGQIPYFARHGRVITFDRRGNGRSDRPRETGAYDRRATADDARAVLDRVGARQAVVVSWCGAGEDLLLAAEHPERVSGLVLIAPDLLLTADPADEAGPFPFDEEPATLAGWAKWNRHYWLRDWPGFLDFFFSETFTEPHSTKQIEDAIGWGLETGPEIILRGMDAAWLNDPDTALRLCARVRCPTLVLQGSADAVVGAARGAAVAAAIPNARLVTLEGSGHAPHLRDPVAANLVIRDFACPPGPPRRWRRGRSRPKRALYISSPIGLGHALRDVAIAGELRALHPGLEIDWLAQHPVTRVLEARGERVHPASAYLASESGHIESESAGHDLHSFQAIRRMDEILLANFMVFHDLAREEDYDLWIGDESWELDYYLHENPELKSAGYAWLTDFVGWLPMADGGEHEAYLTADCNAEMIEHIARFPRVRDRAIFVGDPDDVVPDSFGPGLPSIRAWTEQHYDFAGYVTGFDPRQLGDRASLGYGENERICIVTVGGSSVGAPLLRRVIAAFPQAKEQVPDLRMIIVAGPRIDPAILSGLDGPPGLGELDGLEIRRYVPDLYRHLAVCDLAVVQGGLTTTMELTANRRPFLYFPLGHHFEQTIHVRHRLGRYRAGRCMDYETSGPAEIAAAIATEIGREVGYRPVAPDGAARAAALLADLL